MQTKLKYRLITAMLAAALMLSACEGAGGSKADGSSAGTQSENPLPDDTGTESGPELTGNKDEEKVSAAAEAEPVTEVTAVSMRLARMEGAVSLRNEDGEVLTKLQNMRLAGGNEIATAVGSRAGISLDETKAVTVGEKSHAVVERRKKDLLLDLKNGEMYFSVSRPLEEDESFEIRTSTMVMGVRGTSGYVRSGDAYTYTESGTDAAVRADDATDTIILTSGHVTLVAETGEEQEVRPGQRVDISTSGDRTEYAVTEVRPADFPDLLLLELAADEEMLDEADAQNGDGFREEVLGAVSRVGEALPTDGSRTVFRGTVRVFTYDELVSYQDVYIPDNPYIDHNERYPIILLDEPQQMTCNSVDGLSTGEVRMIRVRDPGFDQYDGQDLIFSIDPGNFWWPSDVSLPISQPRGTGVRVLQPASGYADVIAASANAGAPAETSGNGNTGGTESVSSIGTSGMSSGSGSSASGTAASSQNGAQNTEQSPGAFEDLTSEDTDDEAPREVIPEANRGWKETPHGWMFYAMDGMLKDEWLEDTDGRWYRFDWEGYMLHDITSRDGFTFGADGALLYGGRIYNGADASYAVPENSASGSGPDSGSVSVTDGFIFPDSSTKLLTFNDLRGKTEWECRIARNEIYARHGRMFRSAELQDYFNSCDWYHGTVPPDAFRDETMLSKTERDNIKTIEQYEKTL
ncbi:MAG: YARHG domain-containing protein [Lachnospiraceae bacterium]|nr:YARHG domain-containing protein [Lachnospiraceae bacterium]